MRNKKKLLVICGPTATGKSQLGFKIAQKYHGEIISADSRQVYKNMDIGTGKERHPKIKIWGYDLVDPKQNFSVSDYFEDMKLVIEDLWSRNKLPIIVGGTGLYIKSLIDGIPTIDIPQNLALRSQLKDLSVQDLFDKLATLDAIKAASLNSSDKNNPRRLVRAIEIAIWNSENFSMKKIINNRNKVLSKDVDVLMIGLTTSIEKIVEGIEKRVEKRMNQGFIDEVEDLIRTGITMKDQSMKSLGYAEALQFFKNGLSYEEFISLWLSNEVKYAKRQITWFKKDNRINWFDIHSKSDQVKLEKMVRKWYDSN